MFLADVIVMLRKLPIDDLSMVTGGAIWYGVKPWNEGMVKYSGFSRLIRPERWFDPIARPD